jgi:hypothetical protein
MQSIQDEHFRSGSKVASTIYGDPPPCRPRYARNSLKVTLCHEFEGLKLEGQEAGQGLLVLAVSFHKAVTDGFLEVGKRLVVLGVETLLLDELPQAFNQV